MENTECNTELSNFDVDIDFENNRHPLLINTVLRVLFKYSSIADLKNFRLVSKNWNYEALQQLKKIERKFTLLFENINRLNSFVKTFGVYPQNILNRNLDCGQILVPRDLEPEILFGKILPITSCGIRGLKVNINTQQERAFVAHEAFQQLARNFQTFDVRFIKNDNISLTSDIVYPPTQLPSLPALTSVIIRMDPYVKYGNRIVHPEYLHREYFRPSDMDGLEIIDSESKMLIEFIQKLVAKSPLLSEIHLIMSNSFINSGVYGMRDSFQHKTIRLLKNLNMNELEKITHLRFTIQDEEDITHLLNLAKCGLNKLKCISVDYVVLEDGFNDTTAQKFLEMLEYQKDTLEYFKVKDSSEDTEGRIHLPSVLPKLRVIKLEGNFDYGVDFLDLNKRFPNLTEIDLTRGCGFRSRFNVADGPIVVPCVHVKRLQLDNESFQRCGLKDDYEKRFGQWFPNVTQVKYHMKGDDEHGRLALWTMRSLEHLVLKVPLYPPCHMLSAVLQPFQFICGGIANNQYEIDRAQDPVYLMGRLERFPNIAWLTGLKYLKIKQTRRHGRPEVLDESERWSGTTYTHQRNQTERLVTNILLTMKNLKHFSSDLHCFSMDSIQELKMKILDFQPGRRLN